MNIGNRIRELRKQRGLTQDQLANSIGVSFQAVSKWENGISLPDIALVPSIANYFGVTLDELFDFHLEEVREKAFEIAKESWEYRSSDPDKARELLKNGLKNYPDNDILLNNLLYVTEDPDEIIHIASKIIDVTKDDSTKYDAYRFMAYAYRDKGDLISARKTVDLIPEIYFSRLTELVNVSEGEERFEAACTEFNSSFQNLTDMFIVLIDCFIEKGDIKAASDYCRMAIVVMDTCANGPNYEWARKYFSEKAEEIKVLE